MTRSFSPTPGDVIKAKANFANNLVLADVPVTSIQKLLHVWVAPPKNWHATMPK
ncbi:MAG: hypothetical protein H6656_07415 [Ardenticatenaceae bacterium]|nr:hypothetical protein [Ardenticatenaceae bacterium]